MLSVDSQNPAGDRAGQNRLPHESTGSARLSNRPRDAQLAGVKWGHAEVHCPPGALPRTIRRDGGRMLSLPSVG